MPALPLEIIGEIVLEHASHLDLPSLSLVSMGVLHYARIRTWRSITLCRETTRDETSWNWSYESAHHLKNLERTPELGKYVREIMFCCDHPEMTEEEEAELAAELAEEEAEEAEEDDEASEGQAIDDDGNSDWEDVRGNASSGLPLAPRKPRGRSFAGLKHLTHVQKFWFEGCAGFDWNLFLAVFPRQPYHLTSLDYNLIGSEDTSTALSTFKAITAASAETLVHLSVPLLPSSPWALSSFPSLRTLSLSYYFGKPEAAYKLARSLEKSVSSCPPLTAVVCHVGWQQDKNLSLFSFLRNPSFLNKHASTLRSVELSRCPADCWQDLESFLEHANLKKLETFGMDFTVNVDSPEKERFMQLCEKRGLQPTGVRRKSRHAPGEMIRKAEWERRGGWSS
ncbi:hypothetical protein JCM10213_005504 [Rhodosporidiobolus nylandii]